jgi:hypothetical protein
MEKLFGIVLRARTFSTWRPTRATSCGVATALARSSRSEAEFISRAPPSELFPFMEPFVVDGQDISAADVIEMCQDLHTDERLDRISKVCAGRTFDVVPVIEGTPCF